VDAGAIIVDGMHTERADRASILWPAAQAFEHSARLAEEQAVREQLAGRQIEAAEERLVAARARAAAHRAREHADQWLRVI
jgi:hypothetical protein